MKRNTVYLFSNVSIIDSKVNQPTTDVIATETCPDVNKTIFMCCFVNAFVKMLNFGDWGQGCEGFGGGKSTMVGSLGNGDSLAWPALSKMCQPHANSSLP